MENLPGIQRIEIDGAEHRRQADPIRSDLIGSTVEDSSHDCPLTPAAIL
jgi:hypothetical protein